jgi:ssDNA-binding Zn-finger/Zn-ribbon topoisomerase 1
MATLIAKRHRTVSHMDLEYVPNKKVRANTSGEHLFPVQHRDIVLSEKISETTVCLFKDRQVMQVKSIQSQICKKCTTGQVIKIIKEYIMIRYRQNASTEVAERYLSKERKCAKKNCLLTILKKSQSYGIVAARKELTISSPNVNCRALHMGQVLDNPQNTLQMDLAIVNCSHESPHKTLDKFNVTDTVNRKLMLSKCHLIMTVLEISKQNDPVLLGYFISNCLQLVLRNNDDQNSLLSGASLCNINELEQISNAGFKQVICTKTLNLLRNAEDQNRSTVLSFTKSSIQTIQHLYQGRATKYIVNLGESYLRQLFTSKTNYKTFDDSHNPKQDERHQEEDLELKNQTTF